MSPLWRDEVAVYVATRKLALVRRARGLRPRVVAATEVAVPAGAAGDVGAMCARLADVLGESTWQAAAARVVVSDPWVRYGIVPWPGARLDAAGRLTHARYVLGDTYGDAVSEWAISLADCPPGRSYVACAMPGALQRSLEETLAPARLELRSLQPQLVVAFNAWRHRLPPEGGWFVSVDDGSLSALHLCRGAWDRVHMARLSDDWCAELARLQAFARLTQAAGEAGQMLVDAPAWMRRGVAPGQGIEWLEDGPGGEAQAHELALLGRIYA